MVGGGDDFCCCLTMMMTIVAVVLVVVAMILPSVVWRSAYAIGHVVGNGAWCVWYVCACVMFSICVCSTV